MMNFLNDIVCILLVFSKTGMTGLSPRATHMHVKQVDRQNAAKSIGYWTKKWAALCRVAQAARKGKGYGNERKHLCGNGMQVPSV